jgi:hypothetical protein
VGSKHKDCLILERALTSIIFWYRVIALSELTGTQTIGGPDMKKTYNTPKLTIYGTVDRITQAFGDPNLNDTIYLGQTTFGFQGSQDGVVVKQ